LEGGKFSEINTYFYFPLAPPQSSFTFVHNPLTTNLQTSFMITLSQDVRDNLK